MKDLSADDLQDKFEGDHSSTDDYLSKKERASLWSRIATAAALILLPLLYFFPAVIGKITLVPGDGLSQNLGVRILTGQMLRDGHLPLWNPYIFAGTPLLASIYPGALYPPNWLFALFTPTTAMNIVVITTYHLTIVGTYLYGRRIGMTRIGALIAGAAFTFGGFMIAHMGHTSRIAAAAWLPWILLAVENLYWRLTWRWVALGAAFIALQLFAGEPQMNFYTILVCGGYFLFSFYRREERERRRRFLFGAAAMSVCGALLSAIQLLPERELLQMGERAAISYQYYSAYSFSPFNILTFVFPFFFGGATLPQAKVPYWGKWTIDETCGYFGLLTLLLALVALFGARRRSLASFWGVAALVSLALSLGDYLPFGLNRVLYGLPGFNLFRASGRHMYEFTFSLAMLGGLGASYLARSAPEASRRAARRAVILFAAIVGMTIVVYRFLSPYLPAGETPRVASANALTNFEAWGPVLVTSLSLVAVGVFWRLRNSYAGALMVVVVFVDLLFFGLAFNWGWREFLTGVNARLQDPPAVRFIKSREADLNSFRTVSYYEIFGHKYDDLNSPNVSIARGLQSVNGYDLLRLNRQGAVAGNMGGGGLISDPLVFGPYHQGLNLLNVKYALRSNEQRRTVDVEGIRFDAELLSLRMPPGFRAEASLAGGMASELAVVSTMFNSIHIPDGTPMARIRLRGKDGRVIDLELKAGRDSAEWAYDNREGVRAAIKHQRAKVAERFPAGGYSSNGYLARLPFERAEIVGVEFECLAADASVLILRASLLDSTTGAVTVLSPIHFQGAQWRKLATFGEVDVYENLKALPRAWFVNRAAVGPTADVLETIRTGRMKDGAAFDPGETVLFANEDLGNWKNPQIEKPVNAEVKVMRYEPQRIELGTRNERPGFLTLSEIYYRGWEAWIDGRRAPIERANYALRGVAVPAGEHRIEFVFRAHSFYNGAAWSLFGVLLLLVGASSVARRALTKIESRAEGRRILDIVEPKLLVLSRSRLVKVVAVVGVLIYGYALVKSAVHAVGGSDTSGYLRLARSLLQGDIVQRVTELDLLGLPDEFIRNFIPLAYDPGPQSGTMTPLYPVGMPLLMAAGALIGGWEHGPFLINPIAAALSLILIYLIGLELGLPRGFSIWAAIMLAASPTLIYLALQPMSDAMAMFWGLVAILGALRSRKRDSWALLAGAAFGMAFLIRPTNILLLIPLLFSLRLKPKTILYFLLGGMPTAAIFLAYNAVVFGHPLATGYGRIGLWRALGIGGFKERFDHYWYWIKVTMSPLPLLCWLAVTVDRKVEWRNRLMLLSWFGAFFLFYCCYDDYNAWWYTRFLLPGYPALVLGVVLIARDLPELLRTWVSESNRARLKWVMLIIMAAVPLSHERRYINKLDVFSIGVAEEANQTSCLWADQRLPSKSLIVSMQMSGALKFYTGRPIVRWDAIAPGQWPEVKKRAAERGYQWYALLQPFEVEDARKRMGGRWTELGVSGPISLWQIELAPDQ
jgi:membrane protein YfhO